MLGPLAAPASAPPPGRLRLSRADQVLRCKMRVVIRESPMPDLLSPREKRLLRRLAAGKTDAQIAKRRGGTAKQVSEQRARLLARLQNSSSDEIADAAERWARCRAIEASRRISPAKPRAI